MSKLLKVSARTWLLRVVPLLLLVAGIAGQGLAVAPVVQAAAPAIDNSVAAITVYAPGAPVGSPVAVQYSDASGNWITVSGWTGTLDRVTDNLLVPYKQFVVAKANFGQGPFRWVVYTMDGKTIWGISDNFNLPPGGNINQTETIVPGVTGVTAGAAATATTAAPTTAATPPPARPAATAAPGTTTPAPPANTSLLLTDTGSAFFTLNCGDCGALSGYFLGVPATSWITVQWGDGLGNWTPVQGWAGTADDTDSTTGQLIKHFSFFTPNFGQGPFRWAVYDQPGGTLLGYTNSFTLPTRAGVNFFMAFAK